MGNSKYLGPAGATSNYSKRLVAFGFLVLVTVLTVAMFVSEFAQPANQHQHSLPFGMQLSQEKVNVNENNNDEMKAPASLYPFRNGKSLPGFIEKHLFTDIFAKQKTQNFASTTTTTTTNKNKNTTTTKKKSSKATRPSPKILLFNWQATACLDGSSISRRSVDSWKSRIGGPLPALLPVNPSADSYCMFAEKGIWTPYLAPETFDILASSHVSAEKIFAKYESTSNKTGEDEEDDDDNTTIKTHNVETLKKHKNDFGTTSAGQEEIEHLFSAVGREFTAKNSKVDAAQVQMMMLLGLSRLKKVPMKIVVRINPTTTINKTQNVVRINMIGLSFVRAQMSSVASIFRGFERYFDRGSHTSIRYVVTNHGDYYRIAKHPSSFVEKKIPVFDDFIEVDRQDEVVFFEITYRYLAPDQFRLSKNKACIQYAAAERLKMIASNLTTPAPPPPSPPRALPSELTPYEIREQKYNDYYPPGDDYSGLTSIKKYGGEYSSIFARGFRFRDDSVRWPHRSELPNWARFAVSKHFNLDNCDPASCYSAIMAAPLVQARPTTELYEGLLKKSIEEYRDFLYERNEHAKNNNATPVVPPDWFLNDPRYSPENLQRLQRQDKKIKVKNINARNLYFPASQPPRPRHLWIPRPDRDGGEYFRVEDSIRHTHCTVVPHYPVRAHWMYGGDDSVQRKPRYPLQEFLDEAKLTGETEADSFERYFNTNGICKDMFSRLNWIKYAVGAFLTQPSLAFS